MALAANRPDDPPPHVVAMARRPAEGVRSGLREVEQRVAPQPPALAAALDYVHARGTAVTSQAVWTDDPATDILRAAKEAQSEWIMLGAHHSVFGSDFRGGVVRSITDRAADGSGQRRGGDAGAATAAWIGSLPWSTTARTAARRSTSVSAWLKGRGAACM